MRYIELEPGDVFTVPPGHVVEMHGRGGFGLIRSLDANLRPPVRLRERVADIRRLTSFQWRVT